MIQKDRELPIKYLTCEALSKRLDKNEPKLPLILSDSAKALAGYKGEQTVDTFLSYLPKEKFWFYRGLRLKQEDLHFQMDNSLLSPHFLVIIEVKNLAGSLFFDPHFDRMIQNTLDGQEKVYEDPLLQISRQKIQLRKWLTDKKLSALPIEHFVCIANNSTKISTVPGFEKKYSRICHPGNLIMKINELDRLYTKEILTLKEMKKWNHALLKWHDPGRVDIGKTYGTKRFQIKNGVFCPICDHLPMIRQRGCWFCPKCNHISFDAHLSSINDYFLLIGPTITNKQLREFIQIPCVKLATKILGQLDLPSTGSKKSRIYLLNQSFSTNFNKS